MCKDEYWTKYKSRSEEYEHLKIARRNFVKWFPKETKESYKKYLVAFKKFKINNLTARSIEAAKIAFPDNPNPQGWKQYSREQTKDRLAYFDNLRFEERRKAVTNGEYLPLHWKNKDADYRYSLSLWDLTAPDELLKACCVYKFHCNVCNTDFSTLLKSAIFDRRAFTACPVCRKAAGKKR
ncbi:hypothetical protein FA821_13295 [Salmonella enterica]|nr:hypothetical protein [Salmonella enterica]